MPPPKKKGSSKKHLKTWNEDHYTLWDKAEIIHKEENSITRKMMGTINHQNRPVYRSAMQM